MGLLSLRVGKKKEQERETSNVGPRALPENSPLWEKKKSHAVFHYNLWRKLQTKIENSGTVTRVEHVHRVTTWERTIRVKKKNTPRLSSR